MIKRSVLYANEFFLRNIFIQCFITANLINAKTQYIDSANNAVQTDVSSLVFYLSGVSQKKGKSEYDVWNIKVDCLISDPLLRPNASILLPPYTTVEKILHSATILLRYICSFQLVDFCIGVLTFVVNIIMPSTIWRRMSEISCIRFTLEAFENCLCLMFEFNTMFFFSRLFTVQDCRSEESGCES